MLRCSYATRYSQCNRLTVRTRRQVPVYALKCESGVAAPFRSSGYLKPSYQCFENHQTQGGNYVGAAVGNESNGVPTRCVPKSWWLRREARH
jgi:hypothetical protein